MCANSQNSQRRKAAEAHRSPAGDGELDHRRLAADRRQVAVVAVAEGERRLALDAPHDVGRGGAAHLLGRRADAGHRRRALRAVAQRRGEVADDEDLRMPGQAQVGRDDDAAGAIELGAAALRQLGAERRAGDAGGPDDGPRGDALARAAGRAVEGDAVGVDRRDLRLGPHLDAEALELGPRALRLRGDEAAEDARRALEQDHARSLRVDAAELAVERVLRDLAHRPRHLDAGRAAADDDEGEPGIALRVDGRALGALEGADDAGADLEGVGERLQPGRVALPFVVAEVAVGRARGDDEVVPGDRLAAVEHDRVRGDVDAAHLGLQDRQVAALHLVAQRVTDRRAHRRRAQAGGGDLIQQRLEQVMVGAVDERDLERLLRERPHRLDAAEAAADHQHARSLRCHAGAAGAMAAPLGSIRRSATMRMWVRNE